MLVDDGFTVALYFFGLGFLWIFIAAFLLGTFAMLRKLIG